MFTIRRAIVTLAVAVGLSAASVGLASAAAGGPTSTAPATTVTGASPAVAGFIDSGVEQANDTTDNAWCAAHWLAMTGGGENWFGSLHIASICDRAHA